ncbi:MAG: hypothetical protein ACQEUT_05665 [Bacillota bacterium]
MKQVMSSTRKKNVHQQRMAVLKLEMDYELAVLFEAMEDKNTAIQVKSKEKLMKIREELLKLKAL